MSAIDKLAKLPKKEREKLDPFPSISPQTGVAEEVRFRNPVTGEYLIAEPYNRVYLEGSTVFVDIAKAFAKKVGARGTLLVGPKNSGKTHLLAIEADYIKRRYGGRIIMIHDKEYREYTELADERVKIDEVKEEKSIIKAVCKKLGAKGSDIDALRDALSERGWDAVQIIVDDIYESLWSGANIAYEIFELFKLHTVSKPPIVRTSVAIHTGERVRAKDFFDLSKDALNMLIASYDDGEEFVQRIVSAMLDGELIPGATAVPIVTEWHLYVDEGFIENAFKDFFNKYVSTVKDPELRSIKLDDLADESYIMQIAIKAGKWGIYRVFADEASKIWREFSGEKFRGDERYVKVLSKYEELTKERDEAEKSKALHRFYKDIVESAISKIMELKGAQRGRVRRYRVVGAEVRWRTIEYYTVKGETVVVVVPQLALRKTGVVVERPNEVLEKIDDIRAILPTAHIVGVVTEDTDDRGLREALGRGNYAILKLPSPRRDSALKYFYAPLLSDAVDSVWLNYMLRKYIGFALHSAVSTVKLLQAL